MSAEVWGDPPDPPERVECPNCGGTGKVTFVQDNPSEMDFGHGITIECGECSGNGWYEVPA